MTRSADGVRLRPASAGDRAFVYRVLKEASMPHVVKAWGRWDEALQQENFNANFQPAEVCIIRFEGRDAGFYALRHSAEEFFLLELNILPEFQRRGIGSDVMHQIMESAREKGLPVCLQVLKVNCRAISFYEGLGFRITGDAESRYRMEWRSA